MPSLFREVTYFNIIDGKLNKSTVYTPVETTIRLTVNGTGWLDFKCTPSDAEALALGFLYNERIISSMEEVASVRLCHSGDNVDVWLLNNVPTPTTWSRTTGCSGGFTSLPDTEALDMTNQSAYKPDFFISTALIYKLFFEFNDIQKLYQKVGGVHTSMISDGRKILFTAEDIGRHNTLDKIAGKCLMVNKLPQNSVIYTTGRISSEMMQKASRLSAAVVISHTAATSIAINLSERMGITLICYARRSSFRIYTHPERIIGTNVS